MRTKIYTKSEAKKRNRENIKKWIKNNLEKHKKYHSNYIKNYYASNLYKWDEYRAKQKLKRKNGKSE
jgi:hypothetical protein